MGDGTGATQRAQLSQRRACTGSNSEANARPFWKAMTGAAHRRAFMSASVNRMRVTAGFASSENVASRFSCSQTNQEVTMCSLRHRCIHLTYLQLMHGVCERR